MVLVLPPTDTLNRSYGIDRKPFAMSFHEEHDPALHALLKEKPLEGDILVGFGGLANLDYIAGSGLNGGLILDHNLKQGIFWKDVAAMVCQSSSRQDCAKKLERYIKRGKREDSLISSDFEANQENNRITSWLGNDESYTHVKQFFESDRIRFVELDITDTEGFESLSHYLQNNSLRVGLVHLSNITNFIALHGFIQDPFQLEDTVQKERYSSMRSVVDDISLIVTPNTRVVEVYKRIKDQGGKMVYLALQKDASEWCKMDITAHVDTLVDQHKSTTYAKYTQDHAVDRGKG